MELLLVGIIVLIETFSKYFKGSGIEHYGNRATLPFYSTVLTVASIHLFLICSFLIKIVVDKQTCGVMLLLGTAVG